ncbi:myb family transcription factor PHL5 [Prunus yedoensis var. nudiflora]|uniref:Myb family transcription factor PHL5 n=1 Tax=Prunus yedoensis var. nudiflora TaxID=2094558 RepID=A0A314UQW8_PRUYE|nr:myb family transcription factor PHL5 [Prunus yedoensis var. nudiflora]
MVFAFWKKRISSAPQEPFCAGVPLLQIQRNLQCRIEEQRKQLEKMFDQQKTSNNLLKTQTLDIPCNEDGPSNSLCDTQVLASDGSGNTQLSIQDKSTQESKLFNAHYYT